MTSNVFEGELSSTPFAHILVYAFDRRLAGTLYLEEPSGTPHVVSFARGAPVKVRAGDGYALLGELLIKAGAITEQALAGALSMPALLGDALVIGGFVDRDTLEQTAEAQFRMRMVRLFGLPAETRYRYIDRVDELSEWGGAPAAVDPLELLWAGLREHAAASTALETTLGRLHGSPLRLHASAALERFGFEARELEVAISLRERARSIEELAALGAVSAETVRRMVYALAITRHIDIGGGATPAGVWPEPEVPPSSTRAGNHAVGRMRLRSIPHRDGAAAPDMPGPGEPSSIGVRSRKPGMGE
jgi:hypothetical protein